MRFFRNFILIVILIASAESFAQSVVYKCSYRHGTEHEYIGTTTLLSKVHVVKKINDLTYNIVINNVKNMNEIDDFISIENEKGHKITYAMKCK